MASSKSKKKASPKPQEAKVSPASEQKKNATTDKAKATKDAPKKDASKKGAPKGAVKKADDKKTAKKPNIFKRFVQYCKDVKIELKRVTWPTKDDVFHSSLVVIGALVFFGLLIFAIDSAVVPLLTLYSGLV